MMSNSNQILPQHILVIAPTSVKAMIYFEGSDDPVIVDLRQFSGSVQIEPFGIKNVPSCTVTQVEKPKAIPHVTEEQIEECANRVAKILKRKPDGPKGYVLARKEFASMGVKLPERKKEASKILDKVRQKAHRIPGKSKDKLPYYVQ